MKTVQLSVEAAVEFGDAFDCLQARNPKAAQSFTDDFEQARNLLLQFPECGTPVGSGIRRLRLRRHPFNLIYRVEGDFIRLYAVAHHKKKPGYWRERFDQEAAVRAIRERFELGDPAFPGVARPSPPSFDAIGDAP